MSPTQSLLARRNLVLAMLLAVYILNFLDRQILGILAAPIQHDLHLDDRQMGKLFAAVGLLFSVLGLPLAALADRTSRSWVVAGSLAVWSGFTALCGLATGFWQMFLCRLGVGVGEAGGVAPSYALIAEYFPPAQRGRALAVYSLGVPLGLAAGAVISGLLAHLTNWRTAFIVVGLLGILLTPIFKLLVRDLPRAIPAARVPALSVFPILARKASFWIISAAAAASSTIGYALASWVPSILQRSFHLTLVQTSLYLGSLLLFGGSAGVLAGGWLSDRLGGAGKDRAVYIKLCAAAWALTGPLYAAALLLPGSANLAWLFFLLPNGLGILWLGPVAHTVQHLVPKAMRATATASFLLINNLVGIIVGPLLVGVLSKAMTPHYGTDALRFSALAILVLYPIAALVMWFAVRPIRREWIEEIPERPL